ncbi:hypothetical protein BDEG_22398 [Batrachochytrium dendrobatidis JEL423]|uniref:C2 domain-containing protein n=1 Tax=Batrachochytrium dendrobatidis (strain JEL423) TaxID=403673 RepID=A0A177WFA1_BATDL|nr:hypothetical protein BDEG_22398 [Batrachochytrium dendrobatidis JEL423]
MRFKYKIQHFNIRILKLILISFVNWWNSKVLSCRLAYPLVVRINSGSVIYIFMTASHFDCKPIRPDGVEPDSAINSVNAPFVANNSMLSAPASAINAPTSKLKANVTTNRSMRSLPPKVPGSAKFLLELRVDAVYWQSVGPDSAHALAMPGSRPGKNTTFDTNSTTASNTTLKATTGTFIPKRSHTAFSHRPLSRSRSSGFGHDDTVVRVRWWGADSTDLLYPPSCIGQPGAQFSLSKPYDHSALQVSFGHQLGALSSPKSVSTMTYQILCSHRQFNTYLADMGSLELEIIRNARSTGYVSVKDLPSILANPAKSFNGILPIHSRRGAHRNMQLGLAQVSLAILSLPTHTTPSSHGTTKLAGLAGSLLPQTDIHSKPSKFAMTQGMNAHDTPAGSDNFKYKSSDSNFGSVPENVDQIPLSLSNTDLAFSTQSIFPDMHDQSQPENTHPIAQNHIFKQSLDENSQSFNSHLQSKPSELSNPGLLDNIEQIALRLKNSIDLALPSTSTIESRPVYNKMHATEREPKSAIIDDNMTDNGKADFVKNVARDAVDLENVSHLESAFDLDSYASDESIDRILTDHYVIEALKSEAGHQLLDRDGVLVIDDDSYQLSTDASRTSSISEKFSDDESIDKNLLHTLNFKLADASDANMPSRQNMSIRNSSNLLHKKIQDSHSCRINFTSLSLNPSKLMPDVVWLEYTLPSFNGETPLQGRLRFQPNATITKTSGTQFAKKSIANRSDFVKNPVMYTTQESISIPIQFNDTQSIIALSDELCQFKMTGLMSKGTGKYVPVSRYSTSNRGNRDNLLGSASQLWTATGILKCKEFLLSKQLDWQGKVDFWGTDISKLPQPVNGAAKSTLSSSLNKISSQPNSTSQRIGDLAIAIDFYTSPIVDTNDTRLSHHIPNSDLLPPNMNSSSNVPRSSQLNLSNQKSKSPLVAPDKHGISTVQPMYLHLQMKSAHVLEIRPLKESHSTFLYLVIRLFSSSTPPIQTAPIAYTPSSNAASRSPNDSIDFHFSTTMPLALSEEFLKTKTQSPIVVEIHSIDVSDCVGLVWSPEMHDRSSTTLLGLVLLPFPQLIASVVSSYAYLNSINSESVDSKMPVLIPDTEYAIRDPFSGTSKGWITGFLAAGTWSQIENVRYTQFGVSTGIDKSDVRLTLPSSEQSSGADVENVVHLQSPVFENIIRPTESYHNSNPQDIAQKDFSDDSYHAHLDKVEACEITPAECCIQVCIHRACGILGLIKTLSDNMSGLDRETLDYIKQVGANVFITLTLFPDYSLDNPDFSITDAIYDPSTIRTPLIVQSFAPVFSHQVELTIRGLDTDLISWIRNNGTASGKIWHCVSGDMSDLDISTSILLGEFTVPLEALLLRPSGVHDEWMPAYPAYKQSTSSSDFGLDRLTSELQKKIVAAVQVSVRFQSGMELGEFTNSLLTRDFSSKSLGSEPFLSATLTPLKLSIDVSHVVIPTTSTTLKSMNDIGHTKLLIKWKYPVVDGLESSESEIVWKTEKSEPASRDPKGIDGSWKLDYHKSIVLKLSREMYLHFRDNLWEVQVVTVDDHGHESQIGSAWVDFFPLINQAKIAHRSGRKATRDRLMRNKSQLNDKDDMQKKPFEHNSTFFKSVPLIQADSVDLKGAAIQLQLKFDVIGSSKLFETARKDRVAFASSTQKIVASSSPPTDAHEYAINREFKPSSKSLPIASIDQSSSVLEKLPTLNLVVSVERATHLPLMNDPFADSMVSPFVKVSETQTIPPNSFVSFSWPVDPHQPETEKTHFQSRVVGALTNPLWHYQASIAVSRTERALSNLKLDGNIDFYVYHIPNFNVARDGNSDIKAGLDVKKELIGISRVAFRPLFGGMREIHGWYPLKNVDGSTCGQLMVRISPAECPLQALKELSLPVESLQSQPINSKILSKVQNRQRRSHHTQLIPSAAIAIAPPHSLCKTDVLRSTGPADANEFLAAAVSAAAAKECNTEQPIQNVDTWVWTGTKWEHRQVSVQSQPKLTNQAVSLPSDHPSTHASVPASTLLNNKEMRQACQKIDDCKPSRAPLKKTLTETMQELDRLRESMSARMVKLAEPQSEVHASHAPLNSSLIQNSATAAINSLAVSPALESKSICDEIPQTVLTAANTLVSNTRLDTEQNQLNNTHDSISLPARSASPASSLLISKFKTSSITHDAIPSIDIQNPMYTRQDANVPLQASCSNCNQCAISPSSAYPKISHRYPKKSLNIGDLTFSDEDTIKLLQSVERIELEAKQALSNYSSVDGPTVSSAIDVLDLGSEHIFDMDPNVFSDFQNTENHLIHELDSVDKLPTEKAVDSEMATHHLENTIQPDAVEKDDHEDNIGEIVGRKLYSLTLDEAKINATLVTQQTRSQSDDEQVDKPLQYALDAYNSRKSTFVLHPQWKSLHDNTASQLSVSSALSNLAREKENAIDNTLISEVVPPAPTLDSDTARLATQPPPVTTRMEEVILSLSQSSIERMTQVFHKSTLSDPSSLD